MVSKKTIFLTGATGFLGSNLAYNFFKKGYKLKLLIRDKKIGADERLKNSLKYLIETPAEYENFKKNVEIIHGNLTNNNLGIVSDVFGRLQSEVDTVFHNAALTNFNEPYHELEKQNIIAVKNILEFTRLLKQADFHYVSTAYVCGSKNGIFFENDLNAGQAFHNHYEETKFKAEQLIKKYEEQYCITPVIYRPSIVVGDSRNGKTSNFVGIYSIIKAIYFLIDIFSKDLSVDGGRASTANVSIRDNRLNIPLRIPANPQKTLNIVTVDYVVNVILTAMCRKDSYGKTFHITNSDPPTIEEMNLALCTLFDISGLSIVRAEDLQMKDMTEWEKFFLESINDVTPYLQGMEPNFSDQNTQNLLSQTEVKCPKITGELLSTIVTYYIKSLRFKR
jgi:nucleoside-diphosphate-sugar epimerase